MLRLQDFDRHDLHTGEWPIDDAFEWAKEAAVSRGDYEISTGPGAFLVRDGLQAIDYLRFVGVHHEASRLVRHPDCRATLYSLRGKRGASLERLTADGNYPNVCQGSGAWVGVEVDVPGRGNALRGVRVTNWNHIGAIVGGLDTQLDDFGAIGPNVPIAEYQPNEGPGATANYAGRFGMITVGSDQCRGLRVRNVFARMTRGPGIYIGGVDTLINGAWARDCHRGYVPHDTQSNGVTSGGGMVAVAPTWMGSGPIGNQVTTRMTLIGLQVWHSVGSPAAGGLEIGEGDSIDVLSPMIIGATAGGISIRNATRVNILGGAVAGCPVGISAHDVSHVTVRDTATYGNTIGFRASGACSDVLVTGRSVYGNGTDIVNDISAGLTVA